MLGKMLSPKNPLQLILDKFLTHFKRNFYSAENMLELENQLLSLEKRSMLDDEYTNGFIDKVEFSMLVVPGELIKIDRYEKWFPGENVVLVK